MDRPEYFSCAYVLILLFFVPVGTMFSLWDHQPFSSFFFFFFPSITLEKKCRTLW
jgi:predicted PurR-regulated permease PerM